MPEGLRFNQGKLRYDLLPPGPIREVIKVLTAGAEKYAPRNWEKGMKWSTVLASLRRHLDAFERGEDFDLESGLPHLSHAMANILFLMEYVKTHPEHDDRELWFKRPKLRVWLDIDGVLADFESHFLKHFGYDIKDHATDWDDWRFRKGMEEIANNSDFWSSVPKIVSSDMFSYPITGYCTARNCQDQFTLDWLHINGFPKLQYINVKGRLKSEALRDVCDVFVDDSINNFMDLQRNGILCYLISRPHNLKYDVGHYRVNDFQEFMERVKCLKMVAKN